MADEEIRRKMAIRAFDVFAAKHGLAIEREEYDHGGHICFVGTATNGDRFWIGYERDAGVGTAGGCALCAEIAAAS